MLVLTIGRRSWEEILRITPFSWRSNDTTRLKCIIPLLKAVFMGPFTGYFSCRLASSHSESTKQSGFLTNFTSFVKIKLHAKCIQSGLLFSLRQPNQVSLITGPGQLTPWASVPSVFRRFWVQRLGEALGMFPLQPPWQSSKLCPSKFAHNEKSSCLKFRIGNY